MQGFLLFFAGIGDWSGLGLFFWGDELRSAIQGDDVQKNIPSHRAGTKAYYFMTRPCHMGF
jgi:hypothetical protein